MNCLKLKLIFLLEHLTIPPKYFIIHYEIYTSSGQLVTKGEMTDKTFIPTNNFNPGIYLIKIDDGKTSKVEKIIKE